MHWRFNLYKKMKYILLKRLTTHKTKKKAKAFSSAGGLYFLAFLIYNNNSLFWKGSFRIQVVLIQSDHLIQVLLYLPIWNSNVRESFNPFAAKAIKHICATICHAHTHIHMHAHNHIHTCHFSFCRLLEIEIIEIFLHTFITYIQTNTCTHTQTHTHTCIHTNTHTHTVCIK